MERAESSSISLDNFVKALQPILLYFWVELKLYGCTPTLEEMKLRICYAPLQLHIIGGEYQVQFVKQIKRKNRTSGMHLSLGTA